MKTIYAPIPGHSVVKRLFNLLYRGQSLGKGEVDKNWLVLLGSCCKEAQHY